MKELEKKYNPHEMEDKNYQKWVDKSYFKADVKSNKKSFTVIMPPPNITGQLHMGHALDNTMQDILVRYKRMKGYDVLWQPGLDHAAIATEVKVTQVLKEEGFDKVDMGRDAFLKRAWQWKEEYGNRILLQLRKLGCSADWSRTRFTLDEGCSKAVKTVFIKLYNEGLIYKGNRIVNWCPVCKTSISDAEVSYEEKNGNFWHILYPIAGEENSYVEIATTRPETMLGDTAVAVNPNDERYKHLVGKELILPLTDRRIPVIADEYVDMEFGTGCVKITPAHDPNDFEVGKRHSLEEINIFDDNAVINEKGGKYSGLDRYEARKVIIDDLKALGLLKEVKPHLHNVGTHDRCETVVEPMLKPQWFVKMQPLAKPCIEAVKKDELKLIPKSIDKTYYNWLNNIKDWCISRQLWWGHRIPAYYCDNCHELVVTDDETNITCPKCGGKSFTQDEDTLDTWFSSALWPFSTLGWPDDTEEMKKYYPTDVLVTGYDILFFWVIRMVFSGIHHTNKLPFSTVLFHGLVRDDQGRKMSKSLGNGIDPLEIIEKYGADALRLSLVTGNSAGSDMRFYISRVENARNFANKIWNASRFILMNIGDTEIPKAFNINELDISDKWIISRLNKVISEYEFNMEKFEMGMAVQKIHDFLWDEFCDWYIEMVKPRLYDENDSSKISALWTLKFVLSQSLKLLHPFMPFITEEIYCTLNEDKESIMIEEWPHYSKALDFEEETSSIDIMKELIKKLRETKKDMDVPQSKKLNVYLNAEEAILNQMKLSEKIFKGLGKIDEITYEYDENQDKKDRLAILLPNINLYISMDELVDKEKELNKLTLELSKLEGEIKRSKGMLNNEKFLSKAPKDKIDEEKAKYDDYLAKYEKVKDRIAVLKGGK